MPESAVAISSCGMSKDPIKTAWHAAMAVIDKPSSRELSEVCHCGLECIGIEQTAKENGMKVRRHDDVRVCSKFFVTVAKVKLSEIIWQAPSDTKTGNHSTTLNVTK